jgi:hypothetical protein
MKRSFVLQPRPHPSRARCAEYALNEAPDGYEASFAEPRKSRVQEEKYHAMLGDLARQWPIHGKLRDEETVKRLCVDQFRRDTAKDPDLGPLWDEMGTVEMLPSLDGSGVVALGWQTRRFPKRLAVAFIDWLYALGAEVDVQWSEPRDQGAAAGTGDDASPVNPLRQGAQPDEKA